MIGQQALHLKVHRHHEAGIAQGTLQGAAKTLLCTLPLPIAGLVEHL
jgi:hypothetical protein